MNYPRRSLGRAVLAAAVVFLPLRTASPGVAVPGRATSKESAVSKLRLGDAYGRLPLSFEANQGQTAPEVKFLSQGAGATVFLTASDAVLVLNNPRKHTVDSGMKSQAPGSDSPGSTVLRLSLLGANEAEVTGLERLPGSSNYFIGNDRAKWRARVPTFGKVRYRQVYPGVDLVYYGNQRQLEYDFVVAPSADPAQIRLAVQGARTISIDTDGNAVLHCQEGEVQLHRPYVYQEEDGHRRAVDGAYILRGHELQFRIGDHDPHRALVIDPVVTYGTYLGGPLQDGATGVAVDSAGNAYVVGSASFGFPVINAEQPNPAYVSSAFISKLNPTGTALVYSTYLGGSGRDAGFAIAVDPAGSAYVTGSAISTDFPVTKGAFQSRAGLTPDAFVTKLSPDGASLVYSSYLGGSANDLGFAIAVDASGYAYVAGETQSGDFPHIGSIPNVQNPISCDPANAGGFDAFISKVTPDGSGLVYSLFLGGSGTDRANGVAVDSSGNAYVAGNTDSTDFLAQNCPGTTGTPGPVIGPNSLQPTNAGLNDSFIVVVNPTGTTLLAATYLGTSGQDAATGIALDPSGSILLAGESTSGGPGSMNVFAAKLNASLSQLQYLTYFGGTSFQAGTGVAADSSGNAYLSGYTSSTDFPTVSPFQSVYGGGSFDAFVAELNPAGTLIFSSYLGGSGTDATANAGGPTIAVDSTGNVYVVGSTTSTDFPGITATSIQPANAGESDAFVVRLGSAKASTTTTVAPSVNPSVFGQQVSFTATVAPSGANPNIPTGTVTFNDGATHLGGGTSLGNGVWVFDTTVPLSVGTHSITASYGGDNLFAGSTSAALTSTVNQAATTTVLDPSPNPSSFGEVVTLTATIRVVAPGSGTPSGQVAFFDNGMPLTCTGGNQSVATGQATCQYALAAPGSHSLTSSYGGDTDFAGSASGTVTWLVNKATPTISWPSPAPIAYGNALSGIQLDAASSVSGTFVYSPAAGTVLSAGSQSLSVTLMPADPTHYATAIATVTLVVNKATPTITWTAPPPILFGTPLSNAQLDATASVAGSFAYSPAVGALLPAGIQTLSTTFAPADLANYATVTATASITVDQFPTILSAASTTFTELAAGSFTVVASGFPSPALTETGNLPAGLTFVDNGNGTASLSGAPAAATAGSYSITIMAANGIGANTTQSFTLIVAPALPIYTGSNTTFIVGIQGWFVVATSGTPLPTIGETGNLPPGVTFKDNGDGTATLSGTPGPGTAGTYPIAIQASNSIGAMAMQSFTLTVNSGGPAIVTGNLTTFTEAEQGTFTSESLGSPVAALTVIGSLPGGVTFIDNGGGTGTLSGTPNPGTKGTYGVTMNAGNGIGPATLQSLTLVVNQAVAITSTNTAAFVDQTASLFTISAMGKTTPALTEIGPLPNGVTFVDNGNGSATLAGTPAAGGVGLYGFTVRASNGASPDAIQTFLLAIKGATAVSVSSPTSFSLAGQQVTLTASVNVTSSGPGVPSPTGAITFFDGPATLATVALTSPSCGAANPNIQCSVSFSTSALAAGSHSITAQYSGDAYYQGSASAKPFLITTNQSLTAVSVVPPTPTGAAAGQQVTLVASMSVTASGPGVPPPGGQVGFFDSSVSLGTAPLVSLPGGLGGSATFMTSALAAGSHSITVQYTGDANYQGSTSQPFFIMISKTLTAVTVAPTTPVGAPAGQPVNLAASLIVIGSSPGLPVPSGSLTFLDGGVSLGTVPLASPLTVTLAAGLHSITVQYSGDANYLGSTSQPFSIMIIKTLTAVTVAPTTPVGALAGQPLNLAASLIVIGSSPGLPVPSGSLTFLDGGVSLGTVPLASPLTVTLAAGSHSITVQYSGDANYQGSTSSQPFSITMNKSLTAVTVAPTTPVAALAGQPVNLAASLNVIGSGPGVPVPSGSLTFLDGGVSLGTVPLASPLTVTLAAGSHSITAQYSGDANYLGSTSNQWPITIDNTPPGMGVAVTPVVMGGGSSPVSLVFTNVTGQGGLTSLSISNTGSAPPTGFQLGNPPVYYNLTTTATFTGNVTICINYSGIAFTQPPQLFHIVNGTPVPITTSVDTTNMVICGVTTSFSPFALFAPLPVLTITAPNVQRQYGQTNPSLNNVTYSGFVNGDTSSVLSGTLSCASPATSASPVGTYPITCSGLSSANYAIAFVSGTLTITAAPLSITANNRNKTYGQTVTFGGTEFATSGLVNTDTVTSVALTSAGAAATATVAGSPYAITAGGAVGTGLGNYNISYAKGALTVTPALLTITAGNATKILNATNPSPLGWTPTGFVNGENVSVLTTNPTCSTTGTTTSPVGSYPITCSGASAANYTFSYVAGTLKILYSTAIGHVIQPPINADGSSVYMQGRTVPAKFDVYDANGVAIGTPGVVSTFLLTGIVSGTSTTTVEDVVDTNNPDTAFRWDGQEWIFNITTGNLPAGSTYIYTIALNDGSTIGFQYGLR